MFSERKKADQATKSEGYASKRVSKATIKQKLIEIESGFPAISS